jgi:hypothetical protein
VALTVSDPSVQTFSGKMAFDMKLSGSGITEQISHEEEYFFMLIEAHDLGCPILYQVWESFYDGPQISPEHAGSIIGELGVINDFITTTKPLGIDPVSWSQTYQRLHRFFSEAQRLESVVRCISD